MPVRPVARTQAWLLPPRLNDLVPDDHAVRYVALFVDALQPADWAKLGVAPDGETEGAPGYHPRLLLAVWLFGFMIGVRSCRKLEAACRDQLPFLWLTACQHPDHNTLWRFYKLHRQGMRWLLKRTVRTALEAGLLDLAVQAVDGTRIGGNAARERSLNRTQLEGLLERTDAAILALEAQNVAEDGSPAPVRLPKELQRERTLRERVKAALAVVKREEAAKGEGQPAAAAAPAGENPDSPETEATEPAASGGKPAAEPEKRVNLTDPETALVRTRQGVVAGYNAQAMVSPLNEEAAGVRGHLITAVDVAAQAYDYDQLVPMLAAAEENLGERAQVTLADGGYHSGENLRACEERGQAVLMPESQGRRLANPYHKDHFAYDEEADRYTCPEGKELTFRGERVRKGQAGVRVYRGSAEVCRGCPVFGVCTKDGRQGRAIEVGPDDAALRRQRAVMASAEARERYRQRKVLPEPVFGTVKEWRGARRLLLRGLAGVKAEWSLVATAFNLRTLVRVWRRWEPERRRALAGILRTEPAA